jgi:cytochrome c oxidase subunit 1
MRAWYDYVSCTTSFGQFNNSLFITFKLPVLAADYYAIDWPNFNTSFLILLVVAILYYIQHLFWFFGHPEVYYFNFTRFWYYKSCNFKSLVNLYLVFGMIYAMISIGYGIHCMGSSYVHCWNGCDTRAYFTAATMIIAIPTALKFLVGLQHFGWIY